MKFQTTLSLAVLVAVSSAHTIFVQLEDGSTTYPISYGIADPSYDGPVTDVTQQYVACNGGSGPNPTTPSPDVVCISLSKAWCLLLFSIGSLHKDTLIYHTQGRRLHVTQHYLILFHSSVLTPQSSRSM